LDKTIILTDEQIQIIVKAMRRSLGQDITGKIEEVGLDLETSVRMISLQEKCKEAMEELGLTIKEIAGRLKAPQYRIKAIEEDGPKEIFPDVLEKYIKFLEIEDWFELWAEANPKVAEKLKGSGS